MKHLIIILSLLLLSSPVIGQSTSKYESVNQCVLQTMMEMKLTGKKMFEMVKEECEKYFEKLKKRKGVLFFINRNRKLGWYVVEFKDGKPNGQGTYTYSNGNKYVSHRCSNWLVLGGGPWIGKLYDEDGNIIGKWVNGVRQ